MVAKIKRVGLESRSTQHFCAGNAKFLFGGDSNWLASPVKSM